MTMATRKGIIVGVAMKKVRRSVEVEHLRSWFLVEAWKSSSDVLWR